MSRASILMNRLALQDAGSVLGDDDETPRSVDRSASELSTPATEYRVRANLQRHGATRESIALFSDRGREIAKEEMLKSTEAAACSEAMTLLREPLAHLDGLEGLPPDLIRRCQVTLRGEEALKLVPQSLRRKWSEGTLEKWKKNTMQTACEESASSSKVLARRLARNQAKHADAKVSTSIAKKAHHVHQPRRATRSDGTNEAFNLLENWIRKLRPIAPPGVLLSTIMSLVHGPDAKLPPNPVGSAMRRIVPKPGDIDPDASWTFLDELGKALDLEKQFTLRSQCGITDADVHEFYHTEIPKEVRRQRPWSATTLTSGSGKKIEISFPQAFKNHGGSGFRLTAGSMGVAAGQLPRSPRSCEVPGPGFYRDRSTQRSVSNPNNGEFAPAGKPRTCCALNTVSVVTRFGQVDTSRPPSATLRRPASAPNLGRGRIMSASSRRSPGSTVKESTWGRLCGV